MDDASHVSGTDSLPRVIYSLWLQGIENAPPIVRLNFARWAKLNPTYELRIFDEPAVRRSLSGLPLAIDELTPQVISDLLRSVLLSSSGGVWVDASVFPARPLDDWLPEYVGTGGFFAFERPGPDRAISSWLLAATANNRMMRSWCNDVINYWSTPRVMSEGIPDDPVAAVSTWRDTYPYFWFHYLFQRLLDTDPAFANAWQRCSKLPALPAIMMQARCAQEPLLGIDELANIASLAPVQKLDWRASYPLDALRAL